MWTMPQCDCGQYSTTFPAHSETKTQKLPTLALTSCAGPCCPALNSTKSPSHKIRKKNSKYTQSSFAWLSFSIGIAAGIEVLQLLALCL